VLIGHPLMKDKRTGLQNRTPGRFRTFKSAMYVAQDGHSSGPARQASVGLNDPDWVGACCVGLYLFDSPIGYCLTYPNRHQAKVLNGVREGYAAQ
jgi:hypothetical protein